MHKLITLNLKKYNNKKKRYDRSLPDNLWLEKSLNYKEEECTEYLVPYIRISYSNYNTMT